jgi:hypothetical protein
MKCVRSTVSYYKVGKSHNLAILFVTNGWPPILQDYSSRKPNLHGAQLLHTTGFITFLSAYGYFFMLLIVVRGNIKEVRW